MSDTRMLSLAGLPIHWRPWPKRDPVAAILDCLDGDAAADPDERALDINLKPYDGLPELPPDASHYPLFFHGRTRVFGGDNTINFFDGASLLRLSSDATSLTGSVHPDSLADGHTFSHATLLIALAVALRLRGRFHIHGGLVSLPTLGTILVAGDAAHGKSTTTLSLLSRGGTLAADDTLYLDPAQRCIWGLPKPLNLSPRTADAFALLTRRVTTPGVAENGKRSYPVRALFPGAVAPSLGYPDWLLFPRITGEATSRLEPLGSTDALGGLMTASALVAVDGLAKGDAHLDALLALATAGRSYELLLGLDALAQPALLIDLLDAERQRRR